MDSNDYVSSLAQPEGRALRGAGVSAHSPSECFKPRPTQRLGATRLFQPGPRRLVVSSLAQLKGWALPGGGDAILFHELFQASPNPKVGRYTVGVRPPQAQVLVSILAQPEGRALLQHTPDPPCPRQRFNPRPTRRSGATVADHEAWAEHIVSILAQPEGRALPSPTMRHGLSISFQSSPNPKVGRYTRTHRRCE